MFISSDVALSFLSSLESYGLSTVYYPSTEVLPSTQFADEYLPDDIAHTTTQWGVYVIWNVQTHKIQYVDSRVSADIASPGSVVSKFAQPVRVSTLQNWLQVVLSGLQSEREYFCRLGDAYDDVMKRKCAVMTL